MQLPSVRSGLAIWILAALFALVAQSASATTPPAYLGRHHARGATACEGMRAVELDGASVNFVVFTPAGQAILPRRDGKEAPATQLPAFCRINLTMSPESGSAIGVEIWLPATGWNGRFLGTGNGGGAGKLSLGNPMTQNLQRGFAVANTDLGTAPNALAAIGQPARWRDFGYRANHEMARAARTFIKAFYGQPARHSYFTGCSTGGQQALVNVQRYPDDYDGVLVGAPAQDRTHIHMSFVWNWNALVETPGGKLSSAKLDLVHAAIVKACGEGKDGGAPGDTYLTDPRGCRFDDVAVPRCDTGDKADCLTDVQRLALRRVYSGAVNPRSGERIYPPLTIGAEATPPGLEAQQRETWPAQMFYPFYWALGRDRFQPASFDFDRDVDRVDGVLAGVLNANGTDLNAFRRRGGKILWYHGLSDPIIPFDTSIDYYERQVSANGGDLAAVQTYMRLFLAPGMAHCTAGPGAWNIGQDVAPGTERSPDRDAIWALVQWVENKRVPTRLIGVRFQDNDVRKPIVAQRPLCPYPRFPQYVGGDPTLASSFRCQVRMRGNILSVATRYLN
jgi:feruloyl esterase